MKERMFQIRRKIVRFTLLIQIVWLRFKIRKLLPQDYIYAYPPLCFHESGLRNALISMKEAA